MRLKNRVKLYETRNMRLVFALGRYAIRSSVLVIALLIISTGISGCANSDKSIDIEEAKISPKKRLATAYKYYQEKDFELARATVYDVLTVQPENEEALFLLANIQSVSGRRTESHNTLNRLLALNPQHVNAEFKLGQSFLRQGDLETAKLHLFKANELNNDVWQIHSALGILADLEENYGLSAEYYKEALIHVPNNAQVLNNYAFSEYLQGHLDKAESMMKTVLVNDPKNESAWSNLALVYIKRGSFEKAVAALERVMARKQALNNVGYFLKLQGKKQEANRYFNEAIKVSPTYYDIAGKNMNMTH